MAAHTQGPWRVEPAGEKHAHPVVYAGNRIVAYPANSADVPAPESDENARLIASAPELLAEIKRLRGWLTQIERQAPVHSPANIAAAAALYTSRKAAAQDA